MSGHPISMSITSKAISWTPSSAWAPSWNGWHSMPGVLQGPAEQVADRGFVVEDEDARRGSVGHVSRRDRRHGRASATDSRTPRQASLPARSSGSATRCRRGRGRRALAARPAASAASASAGSPLEGLPPRRAFAVLPPSAPRGAERSVSAVIASIWVNDAGSSGPAAALTGISMTKQAPTPPGPDS